MTSDASQWDLNKAVFDGDRQVVALVEAIRRAGASEVEVGFLEEDVNDRWPDQPITAFAKAKYPIKIGYSLGRYRDYETVTCELGTKFDNPMLGLWEALAIIVRKHGGNVTIVDMREKK